MMKTNSLILILILLSISFGCRKEALKVAPTVTIGAIADITSVSATTSGSVAADGGAAVTDRGICWSATNQTPTTADGNVANGTGLGSFTSSLGGLSPGTTYYVSTYATNSVGIGYSSASTFKTLALTPTLTTTDVTSITNTTASSGGNITSDGGATITARGVCWSTNQNPTIADYKTTGGTGIGSFSSAITNLTPGATYYFRAYATNSVGTTYGNQVIVATKEENITFSITPDNSKGTITTSNDSIGFRINVSSVIPQNGVVYSIKVQQNDTQTIVYKLDSASLQKSIKINALGFFVHANYTINITVASKSNGANSVLKSIQVVKNLKSSYELSNPNNWLGIPGGYASFIQFDYNRDGFDDVVEFEGYDLRYVYTWPGPFFYRGSGNGVIQDYPSVSNKKLFGSKLLAGDFDNNGYKDIFVLSGMDPGGCSNCPEELLPVHTMFNTNGKSFNVVTLNNIEGIWNSGCAGDIDNDGDLDVFTFTIHHERGIRNKLLINNGNGVFNVKPSDLDDIQWVDRSELIDMNRDGLLDLVVDDVVDENGYANRLRILWNDGSGNFTQANSIRIPIPNDMYLLDINAYDFDNDGYKELVLPMNYPNGDWKVLVFKIINNINFQDVTSTYIQDNSFLTSQICIWNDPIGIADIDNNGLIDVFLNDKNKNARWEWNGKMLMRK